ncbi:CDP-6-deoxy-delta-3,4-glucoseen reductase [Acuticoccus sediminis]|uniref:CDP-6-deoxy-delta-3,4-glucoseen reductase n=1 Tax=Acuticoccus sediminis TaxID=2184697 RepID=A0A8B2NVV5_9HYPH|nr:2Fe-2S iron-sulfur cluster binding domain-containing protein [Acuticoccus sediminis]RAI04277.1 CDP-6-deoxy-delta-3,4-glucoseen reductase [Acuticoccus sediminis]
MPETYTVRLSPVDVEFEVEEGETILNAAFRQGIALPHGCKEGQCSACKCSLVDGEVDLMRYSTFALNDMEREQGGILLCRSLALTDVEVELQNFDEELLAKAIAVKTFDATITRIDRLTHDIRRVELTLSQPIKFWAGQYVDITVTTANAKTITRSFSMANPPSETQRLEFIIKRYDGGQFSGELDGGAIAVGAACTVTGPYGACFRRDGRDGHLILVAAGSGMSPIWSILNDHIASGEDRPVLFFYGARTQRDLFYLDEIAELAEGSPAIEFVPVLSHEADGSDWTGARGFVHEEVDRRLKALALDGAGDVYACGPPPMIEALTPVLFMNDFEFERIFFDKFTPSTASTTLATAD